MQNPWCKSFFLVHGINDTVRMFMFTFSDFLGFVCVFERKRDFF